MNEQQIDKHHADVRQAADAARGDEKKLRESKDRTLDRADRREWAQRKFKVGGESRWRETR
jgi:hypothetical protein